MVKTTLHPKGESKNRTDEDKSENKNCGENKSCHEIEPSLKGLIPVDTFGGRVHVKWDREAVVTPFGQLAFFIEFLKTSGLYSDWVDECPMYFTSPNAPSKANILGTILLSVLAGHKRYSHITSIRCDGVTPNLLGMSKVASEDAVRRALLNNIEEVAGATWLKESLRKTYYPLLTEPWILDVDTTVKLLYGHQEGAVVGYNPRKPGRPSHTYHSYMIANIRLILDVEIKAGNENAAKYTAPELWDFLDSLPKTHRPKFLRGDSGFGTDAVMTEAENRGIPYLFKLKQTKNVQHLIKSCLLENDWESAGAGWKGIESTLLLYGWKHSRRVVVLKRELPKEVIAIKAEDAAEQMEINFADMKDDIKLYEYAVLVTSLEDEIMTLAQHYRDRADSENVFDELKNQWGWQGFTTQDLKRSQLMARSIRLIYNWWTLFVRLINPKKHTEAITSRPLLLHAVGKQTQHANQTLLAVSSGHGKYKHIHMCLARLAGFFKTLQANTEQLSAIDKWYRILSLAFVKYLHGRILIPPDLVIATA
jgi:hypothetical protein